jgi:MoxR-like ATPase
VNGLVYDSDGVSVVARECRGYGATPPHTLTFTSANFSPWALDVSRKQVMCRDCDREYRKDHKGTGARARRAKETMVKFSSPAATVAPAAETDAGDEEQTLNKHDYVLDDELAQLWRSVTDATLNHGAPPANIIFFGPSGSGKTEAGIELADMVGLPFLKVDAASMTDPESWFGTREVVVEGGHPVTKYIPSALVEHIQRPGVTFIDEMTRVTDEHRNVLLPWTDGTGRVTNPLTGEVVVRHPHNFIIMAGNRGLQFTGTSAVDPAFTTRALTVEFRYVDEAAERRIAMQETGCDETTATIFTRFAADTRGKHLSDPDFPPISTREVIAACRLAARGLDRDLAAKFAILNQASAEGGSASIRTELMGIWNGVRLTKAEVDAPAADSDTAASWKCPVHGQVKMVPAGVSPRTGKPYGPFKACPVNFCEETEDSKKSATVPKASLTAGITCPSCNTTNAPGRTTFCSACGAVLS